MELTLEIAEGSTYNNKIKEIECEFRKFYNKAYASFYNEDYEKCIQYYHKCLIIDPDNRKVSDVSMNLKDVLNNYFKKLQECAYCSYDKEEFELSKYYFTKCYCLICDNELFIYSKNFKYLRSIKNMINMINEINDINYINDINGNVYDLTYDSLYRIQLKFKL